MANKQIDMRKAKQIFKLYGEGTSKRRIGKQLGVSRNTVTKYIDFFKRYKLTPYEVSEMTLEEIQETHIFCNRTSLYEYLRQHLHNKAHF